MGKEFEDEDEDGKEMWPRWYWVISWGVSGNVLYLEEVAGERPSSAGCRIGRKLFQEL